MLIRRFTQTQEAHVSETSSCLQTNWLLNDPTGLLETSSKDLKLDYQGPLLLKRGGSPCESLNHAANRGGYCKGVRVEAQLCVLLRAVRIHDCYFLFSLSTSPLLGTGIPLRVSITKVLLLPSSARNGESKVRVPIYLGACVPHPEVGTLFAHLGR